MDFVSSLLKTAMESVLGVLLPNPNGACSLLPRLMVELDELKHLKTTDSLDFPGSTMYFAPPERCIWMKEIYEDRPIGQIVWPATHNSATNTIGINFITRPFGQHQTLSIYYQLRYGVRALDIRVQQDGRVCNVNFLSYRMTDVITDIQKFMSETLYEIIILEIRTERGYRDPPDFESYLVHELGDLLIKQDDHVFSKTISQVLPGRIICIWKPKNFPMRSKGSSIWSASYLRGDEFETELPLTKFKANLNNLSQQIPASERNYFYKVEHILAPQASGAMEWLLVWPRHAKVVSKRINEFARLFLSNCNSQDILDRLQIYSTDFIDHDFIVACIALNHSMNIKEYQERMEMIMQNHRQDLEELEKKFEEKVKNLEVRLETTKLKSIENMLQAISKEKKRATQIQGDLEELRKEFEDEKVQMEATTKSTLIENERLMGELGDARKHLENVLETSAKQDRNALEQAQKFRMAERRAQLEKDEAARTSEAQMYQLREQLQQSKKALEDAAIKHAAEMAKIQAEYINHLFVDGVKITLWLNELTGKKCYMIAASQQSGRLDIREEIRMSMLSPEQLYFAYLVFKFSKNQRNFQYFTFVGPSDRTVKFELKGPPDDYAKHREDGWMEILLGSYFIGGGEQHEEKLKMVLWHDGKKSELIVHGIEIRPS